MQLIYSLRNTVLLGSPPCSPLKGTSQLCKPLTSASEELFTQICNKSGGQSSTERFNVSHYSHGPLLFLKFPPPKLKNQAVVNHRNVWADTKERELWARLTLFPLSPRERRWHYQVCTSVIHVRFSNEGERMTQRFAGRTRGAEWTLDV